MLVLTRKVGECIAIGDDIKIIVMQIRGKQVRLGIKAGPETVVHREEVYQRIQEENRQASMTDTQSLPDAARAIGQLGRDGSEGQDGGGGRALRRLVRSPRGSDDGDEGGE